MSKKTDQEILDRAKKRFAECESYEGEFRKSYRDDMRFLFADSDNQDQWPADVKASRQRDKKPMITINKTHTHWLHVVNEAKENKPNISVHPTNDEATYDAAQIFEGLVRHIEYISDAQSAYDRAMETSVGGGIGYWRLTTEYLDDKSFDQEIFIREIADPMSVFLDVQAKKRDRSDARYAFIYEEMPRDIFERKYPKAKAGEPGNSGSWNTLDTVRVCEYYEVEIDREWMYAITAPDGSITYARSSEMEEEARKVAVQAVEDNSPAVQRRKVDKRTINWYMLCGDEILDRNVWVGRYIPIIAIPGEEIKIEGRLDRKGLVRYMKDAQRTYNYNTSAALEFGALQTKIPYMASARAIQGFENDWARANQENLAYLPYNDLDDTGTQPVQMPQRVQPPTSGPVYMDGIQIAQQELMMTSGQYEATFSQQGNEISGKAIDARQSQGQRVTFHFIDSLANGIRYTGKQLIDLIPRVYDTKRVVRIVEPGGDQQQIQLDPQMKGGVQKQENQEEGKVSVIFNPGVGSFDVVAEVGPNFVTRRKEAFEAMKELLAASPELTQVIGDLWMGSADFPNADKLQERMRNWIAPGILGTGPSPQEQQLQQQLQLVTAQLQAAQAALKDKKDELQIKKQGVDMEYVQHLANRIEEDTQKRIDAFKAETDRFKVLAPMIEESKIAAVVKKLIAEMNTAPAPDANADSAAQQYLQAAPEVTSPVPVDPTISTQQQITPPVPQPQPQGQPQ